MTDFTLYDSMYMKCPEYPQKKYIKTKSKPLTAKESDRGESSEYQWICSFLLL